MSRNKFFRTRPKVAVGTHPTSAPLYTETVTMSDGPVVTQVPVDVEATRALASLVRAYSRLDAADPVARDVAAAIQNLVWPRLVLATSDAR